MLATAATDLLEDLGSVVEEQHDVPAKVFVEAVHFVVVVLGMIGLEFLDEVEYVVV